MGCVEVCCCDALLDAILESVDLSVQGILCSLDFSDIWVFSGGDCCAWSNSQDVLLSCEDLLEVKKE